MVHYPSGKLNIYIYIYIYIYLELYLEQHGFSLCLSTYTWIFFQ